MSGPQTEAGWQMLDFLARPWTRNEPVGYEAMVEGIRPLVLAIEREAVAAFLASPEAAEGLATAMFGVEDEPEFRASSLDAAHIVLAARQQERAKSDP